ncbi:helix-turn-helix domain-containing protein [Primorskyibacter sp. S87]|uniref:AraC family transcriptional regulator n=1 Tax=Primorskyibacter sp. S87 TaxID=3415126 RepID=UPI003C7B08B3
MKLADSNRLNSEPLVRLMTVEPFLSHVRSRGVDTRSAFASMGLNEKEVGDPDRLVHAEVVYGLTINLAAAAKDPYLGVSVGEEYDVMTWPHWADAIRNSQALAGFLIQLIESTKKLSSAVTHSLEVTAQSTTYRADRISTGGNSCGQVDGFGLATYLRLFGQMNSLDWSPTEIRYETATPEAIPPNYKGIAVSRAEPGTVKLIFPTTWLHSRLSPVRIPRPEQALELETPSIALAVKNVASDIFAMDKGDMKPTVASRLGLSTCDLDAALKKVGTTFNQVMLAHRLETAKSALSGTDNDIAEIGRKLGFANAANFTRFFKSREGVTPRKYRKSLTLGKNSD